MHADWLIKFIHSLKRYFFYHFFNICRSVSSYFLQMPNLIVAPIRFNIFAKYSTLVYLIFNTSKCVPATSSQSERELQLCNTAHLTSFL